MKTLLLLLVVVMILALGGYYAYQQGFLDKNPETVLAEKVARKKVEVNKENIEDLAAIIVSNTRGEAPHLAEDLCAIAVLNLYNHKNGWDIPTIRKRVLEQVPGSREGDATEKLVRWRWGIAVFDSSDRKREELLAGKMLKANNAGTLERDFLAQYPPSYRCVDKVYPKRKKLKDITSRRLGVPYEDFPRIHEKDGRVLVYKDPKTELEFYGLKGCVLRASNTSLER